MAQKLHDNFQFEPLKIHKRKTVYEITCHMYYLFNKLIQTYISAVIQDIMLQKGITSVIKYRVLHSHPAAFITQLGNQELS